VSDPVGDAERTEFGKVAVVEDQNEMTVFVAQALQHVAVTPGEVPDVARVEVVGLGEAAGIDDRGANPPLEDQRPLGCGGVPVELTHRAGLDPHRNPGNSLGDRQLRDGCLFPVAVTDDLALRLLQGELEGRQVLACQRGIRNVVHETRIAGDGLLRATQRRQRGRGQKLTTLQIGHVALLVM
jgi:hypothetical protein